MPHEWGRAKEIPASRPLNILTWHIHGSYLLYLTQAPHTFYLPVKPGWPEGYGGRRGRDVVGRQRRRGARRGGARPRLRLHPLPVAPELPAKTSTRSSPRRSGGCRGSTWSTTRRASTRPTRATGGRPGRAARPRHAFNDLMWDSGRTPTRVIEHGVIVPEGVRYTRRDGARHRRRQRHACGGGGASGRTSSSGRARRSRSTWSAWRRRRWAASARCRCRSCPPSRRAIASSSTRSATPASAWPSARR